MKKICLLVATILLVGLTVVGCPTPITYEPYSESLAFKTQAEISATWNVDYDYRGIPIETNHPVTKWEVLEESLPEGLRFDSKNGLIKGVPSELGDSGILTVCAVNGTEEITKTFIISVIDSITLTPGKVTVDGFIPGKSKAEYYMHVHNDYSVMSDKVRVITEESDIPDESGFITVDIPITQALHANDAENVISVVGDLATDDLQVLGYDAETNTVKIDGFTPVSTRIIQVSYIADALFSLYYQTKDVDVGQYVTISDTSFVLKPHETKDILITFEIPSDELFDGEQVGFYLVSGRAVKTVGGVKIANACKAVWVVNMK